MTKHYIACDLGAESGRVMLGRLADGKLTLEEVHRFPNHAIRVANSMRWNVLGIFEHLKEGLRILAQRGISAAGLSVDSWGVDYVWMGAGQPMLGVPHHYRDPRTTAPYQNALENIGRETIFGETGIQFMQLNTMYQMLADVEQCPELIKLADRFLTIADYLNYLFSGVAKCEVSLASTTQLYNPVAGNWSDKLIEACGLPRDAFPEIVASGTVLGSLTEEVQAETKLAAAQVIATCSHDTGAAVAAVPGEGEEWAYLSSGTWSLIGVELPEPLISEKARTENFTNEAGFGGTTRFLKNIIGLWLLQECRRSWERDGVCHDYAELNQMAEASEPFRSLVNPNDNRFLQPPDMPAAIVDYCHSTSQPVPETPGQFTRCILESLSLLYGKSLGILEELTGRTIRQLHIVGGGSQSTLLNQFAANATGRTVVAGPVEATAIGNVLIQAIALGDIRDLVELRQVVRNSLPVEYYHPQPSPELQSAIERFSDLRARR
ncbi:rhamnulokinase [Aeoliella mucimassa]|nr:rhamnulokinase family protein [Aeoliella mucimassa]